MIERQYGLDHMGYETQELPQHPNFLSEKGREFYDRRKTMIDQLSAEITELCPPMASDLPKIEEVPSDYQNYPDDWEELEPSQKETVTLLYLQRIQSQLATIRKQIDQIRSRESLFLGDRQFNGSYTDSRNFWANLHPTVLRHVYAIMSPEIPPAKTIRRLVRHSIDYQVMLAGVVNWQEIMAYLAKYPGLREESCYSQGKAPGSIVLEIEANVREAYPQDIESTVNPYTGEKVANPSYLEDHPEYHPDPEQYFASETPFKAGLHSHSDELFCRFDIRQDLKRVIVYDVRLIPQAQSTLEKLGLSHVPVEYEELGS